MPDKDNPGKAPHMVVGGTGKEDKNNAREELYKD